MWVLVNNDFHNSNNLFDLFKDLTVKDLDVEVASDSVQAKPEANGTSHPNDDAETNGKPVDTAVKN